jgi:hypothetical protein
MDAAAIASVAMVVFAWGLFSARLGRADLSAPIVFVTVGLLLSEVLHVTSGRSRRGIARGGPAMPPLWSG